MIESTRDRTHKSIANSVKLKYYIKKIYKTIYFKNAS